MSFSEKASYLLRYLPRMNLKNTDIELLRKKTGRRTGQYATRRPKRDLPKFRLQTQYLPVGFNVHNPMKPFFKQFPIENYYKDVKNRRQYPPLSLYSLQMMIDCKLINEDEPIDLVTICATNHYHLDPYDNCYGVHLTDEGLDNFKAKINIEVQHATEQVIAAIERNGGTITTAYYDLDSVIAAHDPMKFFMKGEPIPKRLLPPIDKLGYYTDPKFRGYLADPDKIAEARLTLAQKYGYTLPDLKEDDKSFLLKIRKDPRQVFFGLEPGWVVNLSDKEILAPESKELIEYYNR